METLKRNQQGGMPPCQTVVIHSVADYSVRNIISVEEGCHHPTPHPVRDVQHNLNKAIKNFDSDL